MKGILTKIIGGFFFVADEEQKIHRTKIRGKIKRKIYPGDIVEFSDEAVESVYPRENLLFRPSVANIDQVLIVQSIINPEFNRRLLERFLIMVEAAGLKPLIVINKIDLIKKNDLEVEFADYVKAGYQLFFLSVKYNRGIDLIISSLHNKVTVLTGPSGVGKSSLINRLIYNDKMAVAEISPKLKRGVHTTRHVELLPIEQGGWVADTPGFTSLNINHIAADKLTLFFPEFLPYLDLCKFRGCSHTHEPGCAVKKAVEEGLISLQRYKSYQLFYQEIID